MVELQDPPWQSPESTMESPPDETRMPSVREPADPNTLEVPAGTDSKDEKRYSQVSDHFSDPQVVENQEHSDLQVDHSKHFSDPQTTSTLYSDLEVAPKHGTAEGLDKGNLQSYHPGVNADAGAPIPYDSGHPEEKPPDERRILGLRRNTFFLILALLVFLIIAAVIGGAVGGTLNHRKSSNSRPTSSTSQQGILANTSLAAVAWKITNSTYRYSVYYQDGDNSIKESLYNSASGSWSVSTITNGSGIRPGTPLAAASPKFAASGQNTVDINVYYLRGDLSIARSTYNGSQWSESIGPMKTGTDSKLGAYYLGCDLCPNTTLLACASNGTIVLYNGTSFDSWQPASIDTLETNVAVGSDVSFQPFSIEGYADQLNLYYQRPDNALVLASWFSSQYQADQGLSLPNAGWQDNGNNGIVATVSPNASIATLYLGNNTAQPGQPLYVEAVTSGQNAGGLDVHWWTNNTWQSILRPTDLQSVTNGTALASHWYQRLYAMDDGALKEYAVGDNGTYWLAIGSVPTI